MAQPGSTSRSKTGYVSEVTPGLTPASPAIQAMRVTSSGLAYTPSRTTSDEIRADRQIPDHILTKLAASGSIGFELSYAAFDDMVAAAMQSAWVTLPKVAVVTSDTEISDLSTTTATVPSNGAVWKTGMLALSFGFNQSANNGILSRVASSTGTTIVFPASSFTAEAVVPVGATLQNVGFQGAAADITATATGLGSTLLDFTTLGLVAGQWIQIGGDAAASKFATAACTGWARVQSVISTAIVCDILPVGWTTDTGTGKTIQVFYGDYIVNGTTQKSFSFERQQQDIAAPSYEYFTGMQLDQLDLSLKAGAILTGQMAFIGMGGSASTTRAAGATDLAAPTYPVLNAASNVATLYENGSAVSGPSYLMGLDFTLKNNLAARSAIGSIAPIGVRNGECQPSGKISAYFGDLTLLNQVLNNSDVSVTFRAGRQDNFRESLLCDVPSIRLQGTAPVSAKNQDRMFNGSFDAKLHARLGYTVSFQRFPYLPAAAL